MSNFCNWHEVVNICLVVEQVELPSFTFVCVILCLNLREGDRREKKHSDIIGLVYTTTSRKKHSIGISSRLLDCLTKEFEKSNFVCY